MRISDWSSDLCSSDLHRRRHRHAALHIGGEFQQVLVALRVDLRMIGLAVDRLELVADPRSVAAVQPMRLAVDVFQQCADLLAQTARGPAQMRRSEEHTYELQSLLCNSYAVFCLKKKQQIPEHRTYAVIHTP